MTDREKLIEMLYDFTAWEKDVRPGENYYKALKLSPFMIKQLADYLISKGVTIPVRCKDCECYDYGYCIWWEGQTLEDDFCSYGERREG